MMSETTPITSRRSERGALELAERGLQRVERARADVAEHDADRAERENPETPGRMGEALALAAQGCGREASFERGWDMRNGDPAVAGCRRAFKTARVYTLSSQEREGLDFPPFD